VESYQEELTKIKLILKNNPKGMTVTDIAHKMNINRNSVAKYLDILLIAGHAEMVTFGPAKVFFPSSRIPLFSILNFTTDYILLLDRDLKVFQISDNLLKYLDIQRADIIGRTIDTFPQPFFKLPELLQNARRALAGREITIEKQYEQQNDIVYLRIKHIPTTFDDGTPGVTLIIENITDRKLTEEKMKRAAQEWEITFNSIADMVFIQDTDFTILRANRSFADFLQMKPEECVGKKCYQLIHGRTTLPPSCSCTQLQHTMTPTTMEFYEPYLHKYLQISASPLLSEDGELSGSVHIIKDITAQKDKRTIEWSIEP
jgi:PAS domain S-box-containing protein